MSKLSITVTRTFGLAATALLWVATTAGAATTHYVNATNSAPSSPYTTWASAATRIQDAVDMAVAGDLILVTNGLYATGGHVVYGALMNRVALTKAVTVRSMRGPEVTIISGAQDPTGPNGDAAVRCVYLVGGASLSGFTLTNGATRGAAGDLTTEQAGGGVWCESVTAIVSNCVVTGCSAYHHGAGAVSGTLSDCLLTNNLSSYGGGAYDSILSRCTLAGNGAAGWGGGACFGVLSSCTLTGNSASYGGDGGGGGAYDCTLTNCTLNDNWVEAGSGGGGVHSGTLANCMLNGNYAYACNGGGAASADLQNCALIGNQASSGGGAYDCTLNNCTLSGNWASVDGGGAYGGGLTNCIVYYNSAFTLSISSNWVGSAASYCCTTPLPPDGAGNLTNAPGFVDLADGNLRLLPGSPCINAGLNAAAPGPVDLDGNPRMVGSKVDLGAYEWQGRPQFVGWQPPGPSGMTLYLVGETGRVVDFYASSNLAQWFYLARRTNSTGQVIYTDPGTTNQPRRSYRAIQQP